MSDLPEEIKEVTITETEAPVPKTYIVGTISVTDQGEWRVDYIGWHADQEGISFRNGAVTLPNVVKLLNFVGLRLRKTQDLFIEKIAELRTVLPGG